MTTNYSIYNGPLDDGDYPQILYKYRDWNKMHHDRYIRNREIYMAPASSFDDEHDCKIPIRYDLLNPKQTIDFALRLSKLEHPEFTRQQHRKDAREWAKQKLLKNKRIYDDFQEKYFKETDLRRGVLCVTEFPCLERMWNEYANNSTGFCVGYNSRIMFEFLGGGGKVNYDELPIILPEPIMPPQEIHHKQVFFKVQKWIHENEYRTHVFHENPLSIKERRIGLPKEAFNKIILGRNILEKDREDIIQAVRDNIGDIPIEEYKNVC
ncbi:MAG: DUF2971 domain-containing protein [Sphingobacteriaceae bacterium]